MDWCNVVIDDVPLDPHVVFKNMVSLFTIQKFVYIHNDLKICNIVYSLMS